MNLTTKTEATRFILPMIHPELQSDFFINNRFVNCYIKDENKPHLKNVIFLVYNYINSFDFIQHEKRLIKFDTYLTDYDYEDRNHTIYAFKTPIEFYEDREKIISGLYSQISSDYKYRLLRFWNVGIKSNYFGVLYKTPVIKQYWIDKGKNPSDTCMPNEYWPKPIIEDESIKVLNA